MSVNALESPQVARWVLTYNNFENELPFEDVIPRIASVADVKRAVVGREISPTTGVVHLQGYLEFTRSKRLAFVRRIFNDGHWDRARGTALQNYNYCTKGKLYE